TRPGLASPFLRCGAHPSRVRKTNSTSFSAKTKLRSAVPVGGGQRDCVTLELDAHTGQDAQWADPPLHQRWHGWVSTTFSRSSSSSRSSSRRGIPRYSRRSRWCAAPGPTTSARQASRIGGDARTPTGHSPDTEEARPVDTPTQNPAPFTPTTQRTHPHEARRP